jgi:hypothetical protein
MPPKVLAILGHPSRRSLCEALADAYAAGADVTPATGGASGFPGVPKTPPLVASHMAPAASVTAFRETMARTLTITMSAFVAFAIDRAPLLPRHC